MEIFALDLGNKQTKMVSSKVTKVYPSNFMLHEDMGKAVTMFKQKEKVDKFVTSFDSDFEYAWGQDINKVRSDKRYDTINFNDRYKTVEFQLLSNFALAELAKDFEEARNGVLEVVVVTGVPSNDYIKEDLKSIIKVLKGDHNVLINDVSHNIRVKEVYVMEQPIGTIYNEMLDNQGYMKVEDFLDETITVVDIGGGTLLIDTLNNLNVDPKQSTQKETGVFDLYNRIIDNCSKNGINGLTQHRIEQILRTGNEKEGYFYKPNKNESLDITNIVDKSMRIYTREVINTINTTLKDRSKIDRMLFTGGGSELISKQDIKKAFDYTVFMDEPETANVYGYYKNGKAVQLEEAEVGE